VNNRSTDSRFFHEKVIARFDVLDGRVASLCAHLAEVAVNLEVAAASLEHEYQAIAEFCAGVSKVKELVRQVEGQLVGITGAVLNCRH
jgi:hypothetical protein